MIDLVKVGLVDLVRELIQFRIDIIQHFTLSSGQIHELLPPGLLDRSGSFEPALGVKYKRK